ncbi:hypothetical protein D3C78_1730630 [compost metagenome]
MLAQGGADLDVVLPQGHDPIDPVMTRHVAHGVPNQLGVEDVHHREELVDDLSGPVVAQRVRLGQNEHPMPLSLDLAEEGLRV